MDRLELELRELLSDDRLDVPVRDGAVQLVKDGVRRRRRRRTMASSAAAGVVVLATVTTSVLAVRAQHDGNAVLPGEENSPTPSSSATTSPTPTSSPTAEAATTPTIAWSPAVYDAQTPFAFPGTIANSSVPWCNGKAMALTVSQFQGATGSAAATLTVVNHGASCGLQGLPSVTGFDANDTATAQPTAPDDFVVHPWFVLPTGHKAVATVQISGDQAACRLGPVTRLMVDLGHGGRTASADITATGGGDVRPRCGAVPAAQQTDHYTVTTGSWARPDGTPKLTLPNTTVAIGRAPRTVMQGTILRYQVLVSGTSPVKPCLPYREQLTSTDITQTVVATEDHMLACHAIARAGAARSYLLDMQLTLHTDTPVGDAQLSWETPLPGIGTSEGPTIRIVAAPPRCERKQLSLTAGGELSHDNSTRADYFVYTNTSSKTCSLHGIPGIKFVDANGQPLRTADRRAERTRFWNVAAQTYVLAPHGGTVSFAIAGATTNPSGATCPVTKGIKFIPPNGLLPDQMYVADAWPWCGEGRVLVSPVVPGSKGPR